MWLTLPFIIIVVVVETRLGFEHVVDIDRRS
jgi:hypothetical protein